MQDSNAQCHTLARLLRRCRGTEGAMLCVLAGELAGGVLWALVLHEGGILKLLMCVRVHWAVYPSGSPTLCGVPGGL
jgi:hypothetical protein